MAARQRGGTPPNEKAAARGKGSGQSHKPSTTRAYTAKHSRARQAEPGEITVYSGRDLTGWLQPRNGRWLAFAADGRFLGSHSSDKIGARAIYETSRPGGEQ